MPVTWTPTLLDPTLYHVAGKVLLEEEVFEEQRPLYVGKEAGQEAQRAFRAQTAEQAARVAAIRAAEPAPIVIASRTPEQTMQARERMPQAFLPVETESFTTWAERQAISEILGEVTEIDSPEDPERFRQLQELRASETAQIAAEALQKPVKSRSGKEKAAILEFYSELEAIRSPTPEKVAKIEGARRSFAKKVLPAKLEQPPKRLQAQVAKRMAPIDEFEQGWKAEIARQNRQIRSSRMTREESASALEALAEKENDFRIETFKRRMAVQDWWQRQVAEEEAPIYFPEGEEERIRISGGLAREVKFGARAEAIELATGVAEDEPEEVREMARQTEDFYKAYLDAYGADLFDAMDEEIGRAVREAAQLDIHAELAAITAQRNALKMSTLNANAKRAAMWAAHQMAKERYQRAVDYIRRARAVRRESQAAPIRDIEIGEALRKIGPERIASADRFTQELRGLYEYVELPDPITGRLERARVPKLDEKNQPIYLGILTKYAGAPGQTGSFMGQKMRVRQSATGAYERSERAELGVERAIDKAKADKRTFARLVLQFNDYSQGEIDRGFTSANIDAQRSAPRDEGLIKYYIREYGFVLPEWSKMPVPKRFRDTPTAVWQAEYGYGAPRKKTTAEGEADAARRRRQARSAAIAASRRKTSRPQ
jgi:hypothetical protein